MSAQNNNNKLSANKTELRQLFAAGSFHFPGEQLNASEFSAYGHDQAQQFASMSVPGAVARPANTAELQALVRFAGHKGIELVPSGGRTGLCGGAVASRGEIVVSLEKMDKVHRFDPYLPALSVGAGMITARVQQLAAEQGWFFPIDFASAGSSQIGGNVATNAGGIHVLRYGMMRQWVLGLEAVLGNGEVIVTGAGVLKNNVGPDLTHLFVGSEGIFGIVSAVTVRLTRPPGPTSVALLAMPGMEKALEAWQRLQRELPGILAFEVFDNFCLEAVCAHTGAPNPFAQTFPLYGILEFEQAAGVDSSMELLSELQQAGALTDVRLAESSSAKKRFWSYRENVSESLSARHRVHKNDVSIPLTATADFLRQLEGRLTEPQQDGPGIRAAIFGHLGDANLHINLIKPAEMAEAEFRQRCLDLDDSLYRGVQALGGSLSAEHGIGLLKAGHLKLARSPEELRLLREAKRSFDPHGIMNPGKVLPAQD